MSTHVALFSLKRFQVVLTFSINGSLKFRAFVLAKGAGNLTQGKCQVAVKKEDEVASHPPANFSSE